MVLRERKSTKIAEFLFLFSIHDPSTGDVVRGVERPEAVAA